MRILLVHNYYGSSAPSGENTVFEAECALLRAQGQCVETFTRHSDAIRRRGLFGKILGAFSVLGNPFAARDLARVCRAFRPDVVHFHNTFPLISLLAVRTASHYAPVVMTLHNYRLFCAAGIPMRAGKVCTDCLDRRCAGPAIAHRCYRHSLLATLPLAGAISFYRARLPRWVARFIVLSEFQKTEMVKAGLPADKLAVKPNFIRSDAASPEKCAWRDRGNIVYVGRLSDEKGLATLIAAWRRVEEWMKAAESGKVRLTLIGDGDARARYERLARGLAVDFAGQKTNGEVRRQLARARGCVLPSEWFEGMPMTILEALAAGTPCVVSDLGALPDIVENGRTGFVFEAGNADALAEALVHVLRLPEDAYRTMCTAARAAYERRFTPESNYTQLMEIYTGICGRGAR